MVKVHLTPAFRVDYTTIEQIHLTPALRVDYTTIDLIHLNRGIKHKNNKDQYSFPKELYLSGVI